MDIKRLLESGQTAPELSAVQIDHMVDSALAYPQLQRPANQNKPWMRQLLATAAAIVVLVIAGIEINPFGTEAPVASTEDAYQDMTDLMIYETLNDLT